MFTQILQALKSSARKGLRALPIIVLLAGALALQAQVPTLNYEVKGFPQFTATLPASSVVTNTHSIASRDLFAAVSLTNTATAIRLTPGYPIAITISSTTASANSSNQTYGFSLSGDGTNYNDAANDMILVTIPGTGGAHTNRTITSNLTAAVLGGANWISWRHGSNQNSVVASALKITASVPKR